MQEQTVGCWVLVGAVMGLMNLQIMPEIHHGH